MNRSAVVILLIANLLACPLRCLSCETSTSQDSVTANGASQICCHACQLSSEEDSQTENPSERDTSEDSLANNGPPSHDDTTNHCSCHTCICEGARIEWHSPLCQDVTVCFADWQVPSSCQLLGNANSVTVEPPLVPSTSGMTRSVHQVWRI